MLSVIVIARNEEDMIKTCLESVKWAGEIIVIDNGSTDKTEQIAKPYTNKIYSKVTDDFSEIRNFGIDKASGDWILYVDCDERVLESLKEEIEVLIARRDGVSAYAISRKNIIFGKEVNYGPYQKDWVIRLLRKKDVKGWIGRVHEYPKYEGDLGYTKNSLLHLTHRNVDQVVLKSLDWSKIDAKLRLQANHPKMSGWRFIRILFTELFNQGIKRRGFFNGSVGVIDSLLQTFSMVITYIRLWQLQQKDFEEVYEKIDKKLMESKFRDV